MSRIHVSHGKGPACGLCARLVRFAFDRRGAAALLLGLGVLPAVALGTGAFLVNREFMNLSAMERATDTAVIALAKIQSVGADAYLTAATAQAWVNENTSLLKDTLELKTVTPVFAEQTISLTSEYASKPRLTGAVGSIFA